MNSVIPTAVAIGVISCFWWLIRVAKRQIEERRHIANELGFTRAEEIPADFVSRVESLYGKTRGKIRVRNLFIRGCGRYDLYVFDLTTGYNSDHSEWTAAIVSHDFKLPSFRIFPAMPFTGTIALWVDKVITHLATKQGFTEYKSHLPTQFTCKYRLYIADERTFRQAVPETVWAMVASLAPVFTLQAQDDIILFTELHRGHSVPLQGNRLEQYRASLRTVMEHSDRLHRVFSESGRPQLVH